MPEAKEGFFTMYCTFNKIVLDVLMEKLHIQVNDDTLTQSALLNSDIPDYELPTLDLCHHQKNQKKTRYSKKMIQRYIHT